MGQAQFGRANPAGLYLRLGVGSATPDNPNYYLPVGIYPSLISGLDGNTQSLTIGPQTYAVVYQSPGLTGDQVIYHNPTPYPVHLASLGIMQGRIRSCRVLPL
jgi:hypothetical protein